MLENIDNRFSDSFPALEAFNVFDPVLVPDSGVELRNYGHHHIVVITVEFILIKQTD